MLIDLVIESIRRVDPSQTSPLEQVFNQSRQVAEENWKQDEEPESPFYLVEAVDEDETAFLRFKIEDEDEVRNFYAGQVLSLEVV